MKIKPRNLGLAVVVLLVATAAFYATVVVGQPAERKDRPDDRPTPESHLARFLHLDEEQAKKLEQADPECMQDLRLLNRKLEIERLKLANLVEQDESTEEQLKAQFDAVGQAQLAIHNRVAKHVLALRPLLNRDQRAAFMDMLARHLRGGGPGGPPGPGGPGGPEGQGPPHMGPPPPPPPGPRGMRDGRGFGPPPHDGMQQRPPRHMRDGDREDDRDNPPPPPPPRDDQRSSLDDDMEW